MLELLIFVIIKLLRMKFLAPFICIFNLFPFVDSFFITFFYIVFSLLLMMIVVLQPFPVDDRSFSTALSRSLVLQASSETLRTWPPAMMPSLRAVRTVGRPHPTPMTPGPTISTGGACTMLPSTSTPSGGVLSTSRR